MTKRSYSNTRVAPPEGHVLTLPQFEVDGIGILTGQPWRESFTCVPVAAAGVLDDLAASMSIDAQGRMSWHQAHLLSFFRGVLLDQDVERFDALVHDKDKALDIQLLGQIMLDLAADLTGGFPTTPSGSSPGGPTGGATTSQAGSDGQGSQPTWPPTLPPSG